ncbi:MAG: hypothetical protein U0746_04105 [Gemmataceae bacterium]
MTTHRIAFGLAAALLGPSLAVAQQTPAKASPTGGASEAAIAAREKKSGQEYFLATWATQGHVVFNTVKTTRIDSNTVERIVKMGGGHVGGYVAIKADGTYVRSSPAGVKSSGKWSIKDEKDGVAILLPKADPVWGDMMVRRRKNAEVLIQSTSGGAGFNGWEVEDTSLLDLDPTTDDAFFLKTWKLHRNRTSPLLKKDYGTVTPHKDHTYTCVMDGKTTTGRWERAKDFDGIVLRDCKVDDDFKGDFTVIRLQVDNRMVYLHGVKNTYVGLYGYSAEPAK